MRIKEIKLYQFNELSEKAKEKARDWWREASADDNWYESTIDDCIEILKHLGYDDVKIAFSGFWSQGDGASFTGWWRARDVESLEKIKESYPPHKSNKELLEIAEEICSIAKQYPATRVEIKKGPGSNFYCHENTVSFENYDEEECFTQEQNIDGADVPVVDTTSEANFAELSRDLMRWIYKQLEKNYEWQNADEQVDEAIEANGYEFTEDGVIK